MKKIIIPISFEEKQSEKMREMAEIKNVSIAHLCRQGIDILLHRFYHKQYRDKQEELK